MSYHNIFFDQNEKDPLPTLFTSRADITDNIKRKPVCDVLVVGGGIHGACVANVAALNGLRVILLEQADYAQATSSSSSKLIHGGLRYLENFDFKQVFEGLKNREDLLECAKHLVVPHKFMIPVRSGDFLGKLKFKIGLFLYDLLRRNKSNSHHWQYDLSESGLRHTSQKLAGAYVYVDGVTEDARLVLEHIMAARQEGALCLNYAKVVSLSQAPSGILDVGWFDSINQTHLKLTAGIVVNCTGPWVAKLGRLQPSSLQTQIKYSQGSHIIFNQKHTGPCLFMPRAEKGRYYFVLAHPAGTMVGTTEYPVEVAPLDCQPKQSEINELLALLKKDLPGLNLTTNTAHYCFSGIRTLPLARAAAGTKSSQISRRHIWHYSAGVLSLIGGKYTTARSTAFEAIKEIFKLGSVQNKAQSLVGRTLPGASMLQDSVREFQEKAHAAGVPDQIINSCVARRGSLIRYIDHCEAPFTLLGGVVLAGDVELAIRIEQARTINDIMRRRCGLEYLAGHGLAALDEIGAMLEKFTGVSDIEQQKMAYRERMQKVAEFFSQ